MYLNYSSVVTTVLYYIHFSLFHFANGHPQGAPASKEICTSMRPFHGELSMNSDLPFKITLDRVFIRGTGKIRVTVDSKDASKYTLAGFLFMVKRPNDPEHAYGTFDPRLTKDDLQTIPCFGKAGSALTHKNNKPKSAISFEWIAPNDTSAMYEFHATLVRDFNSFWADYTYPRKIEVSVNAPANMGIVNCSKISLLSAAFIFIFLLAKT